MRIVFAAAAAMVTQSGCRCPEVGFSRPVVNPLPGGVAADPFVTYDRETGYYYMLHTCCKSDGFSADDLRILRSRTAADVRMGEAKLVYTTNAADRVYGNIWAPEMHKAPNGRWYIYTSCRFTPGNGQKRLIVFESRSSDPWDGFVFRGFPAPDLFAIDPTVTTLDDGRQVICYSEVKGEKGQVLTIRELRNPWTFGERQAELARAELAWELVPPYDRTKILEGPFFISPDGRDTWCCYHSLEKSDPENRPMARLSNLQRIGFDETGFPVMGSPVFPGVKSPRPSGE